MLVYNVGSEGSLIIEREYYNESIFNSQYKRALRLIEKYVETPISGNIQIVCFSGDRGEGKTSCMQTVRDIILSNNIDGEHSNREASAFLEEIGCKRIQAIGFEGVDIIDPSFFDSSHNLLEVIIGKLYGKLKDVAKNRGVKIDRIAYRNLSMCFENVKRSIFSLHKSVSDSYSELTELDMLSSSTDLQKQVDNLIREFLKFIGKDKLLITIDDIDMNMASAYEMCEHIRKYLSTPVVVVLMAAKLEQLEEVVSIGISNGLIVRPTNKHYADFEAMAQKYLLKLLPIASRIFMPTVYAMCNQKLRVRIEDNDRWVTIEEYKTIKDAIVKIIFRKTRFLFFNSKGGVSLIVPNNLRQMMSMLGMLYSMEEIHDQTSQVEGLLSNKATFKNYFFHSWPKQLPDTYVYRIKEWIEDTPYSVLNKSVVAWIKEEFKNELGRQYNTVGNASEKTTLNLISSITVNENFSYNVSVGDVFYLMSLLTLDHLDTNKEKMLFFIKSLYSIMLYEIYDIVTTDLYDKTAITDSESSSGIYRVDHRFDGANSLQILINGAFFSYFPGELLPTDLQGFFHFDKRVINGSQKSNSRYSISALLEECDRVINSFDEKEEFLKNLKEETANPDEGSKQMIEDLTKEIESDKQVYRMAEFFILCISMSLSSSDIDAFYQGKESYRCGARTASFTEFNRNTGYYVFDIMAPFYNLTNIEFCFHRFNQMVGGMFDFSYTHDFSLISNLINLAADNRKHIESENKEGRMHCLLSDSVLRNGEVISAIFENAQARRFEDHVSTDLLKIIRFYEDIYSSGMKTHSRHYLEDDSHLIVFNFLHPLIDFLKNFPAMSLENQEKFREIFDYVEAKREAEYEESSTRKKTKVKLTKDNPPLTDNQIVVLSSYLLEIFGEGEIGDNGALYDKMAKLYSKELSGLNPSDLIKNTEKGERLNYDVSRILEVLQQPRQAKQRALWKKLFKIK